MPPRPRSSRSSPGWLASARSRSTPYTGEVAWSGLSSDTHRSVLDNGLRVLVKEVYPASVVSLAIWVGVGALHEPDEVAGISHFVEHMLFKGTQRRPVGRLAREIHALGGYLNGFTSYECTCYWIVLPSRHLSSVLEVATDALLHPLFDPAEAGREIGVILDEMRMYQDRPDYFCMEKLLRLAFPRHRYGRPVIGLESSLRALDASLLRSHYDSFYAPNNMAVTVVGDVDAGRALSALRGALGDVPARPLDLRRSEPEPPQEGMRRLDLEGDLASAHLQMGFRIPSLFGPDSFACGLLASLLGDGRSSRLGQRLRERRGLVTRIGCSALLERDPGLLIVDCTLPSEHLEAVEAEIFEELDTLCREGATDHEMQKARNRAEASFVFGQETVEGQGRKLGYYEMLGDHTLAEDYVRRLAAVTAEEVLQSARRYLRPEQCSVVRYRPSAGGRSS